MSALLPPLYHVCPCCGETDNKPYRYPLHTPEGRFFAEFLGPVYGNWPGQVSPECCSPWVNRDVPWLGSSGTRWFEGLHCHLLGSQSYWDHVSISCVVLYTKNTHRVLRNKVLYKESKYPTKSKKKLKIKDSKNYDLFLTMGMNSIEYTLSSLSMWVWIACVHLRNSREIYSLSSSQHDDKVLLMCQIQGLGVGIGKSGTYIIIWLKDFRLLVIFLFCEWFTEKPTGCRRSYKSLKQDKDWVGKGAVGWGWGACFCWKVFYLYQRDSFRKGQEQSLFCAGSSSFPLSPPPPGGRTPSSGHSEPLHGVVSPGWICFGVCLFILQTKLPTVFLPLPL